LLIVSSIILSCSTGPETINFGSDQCDHCRMTIVDNKFAAEIVTIKGRVFKFDAAECMIMYIIEEKIKEDEIKGKYVTDASKPGSFIDAVKAHYLISENFPSPMGANLSAYGSMNDAETFHKQYSGDLKTWDEVLIKLKTK
jgi:copper chaperone NosL